MADAFTLLQTVKPVIGDDAECQRLLTMFSSPARLTTDPPGAAVSWRTYEDDDPVWVEAGITPVDLRLPAQFVQLRFQKEGFTPIEIAAPPLSQTVKLFPLSETPVDMVYVTGGVVTIGEESVRRSAFWLDKFEVTNRRYKAFVDAGSYRDPKYWKVPFQVEGRPLTFRDAMGPADRQDRATWPFHLGIQQLSGGRSGLSRPRHQLVRGSRTRGVRREESADRMALARRDPRDDAAGPHGSEQLPRHGCGSGRNVSRTRLLRDSRHGG